MARENSKQVKRQRHKISIKMFLFLISGDLVMKRGPIVSF